MDSVSVRVDELVKDRRPPISAFTRVFDALWAAALRAVLDKIANTNNWHPCDQGRHPIIWDEFVPAINLPARGHSQQGAA